MVSEADNSVNSVEVASFWQQRYEEKRTGWDLGQPAPPFVSFLDSADSIPPGRVAVLGCGRGYDALLFATKQFQVIGFDFAPAAISEAQKLAAEKNVSVEFLQRDIFELEPAFLGSFDYVVEHTCFCAIPPSKRADYVQLVKSLLRPSGELIALFFTHSRQGGPPFGVSPAEIKSYFAKDFELISLQPVTNSIPARQDEEHFGRFRRR
ncbi:TPMT family class I SAM-dependent methyltransferase [Ancylothrix sp. C2]|uniref:TPMT family class I SAM-dependent methyltransferase n=1 Tax=Ancylothrix sp. D3o TaxID=2953691 RepID=UPI0021BB2C0E|nr:TPMT family class I SAM-dependent methyltransferase [Ancylothrix sp. D3o]MCT7951544.1 TPMT family class I SAM-dependent methyltransferase [Ancylothrix sp. D3o]